MADPYAPFGYNMPPMGAFGFRPLPQPTPAPMPPMQAFGMAPLPPQRTAVGGLMPQSGAEAADVANDARSGIALMEALGIGPLYRSGKAASEGRPLEAVGNAATAAIPFRPALGLGALGATYGAALGADALPSVPGMSQATAQTPAAQPMSNDSNMLMSLINQQSTLRAAATEAKNRMETERGSGEGNRFKAAKRDWEQANARADAMDAQVKLLNDRLSPEAQQSRTEYSGAVNKAETGLREARGRLARPFRETNVGRLYEETGGWTPAVVGAGTGALMRGVGHTPLRSTVEGVLAGAATPNAPFVWDLFSQPAYNPEKAMYSDYARDLPPTHPRREEWQKYAAGLPNENPVRRAAENEFYNLPKFLERTGLGAYEGLVGGAAGTAVAEGGRRIVGAVRSALGSRSAGRQETPNQPPGGNSAGGGGGGGQTPPPVPPTPPPPPTYPHGGTPGQFRRLDDATERARRADRGFQIPADAPGAGAVGETWVSPAGRDIVRLRSNGTWAQDGKRGSATAPRERNGWRRISEVPFGFAPVG